MSKSLPSKLAPVSVIFCLTAFSLRPDAAATSAMLAPSRRSRTRRACSADVHGRRARTESTPSLRALVLTAAAERPDSRPISG
jgi:hypothetical protein